MKHKLIKLISLFLALIFVFSLFCIPASALETKRIAGENRYDTSIKIADELKSVLGVKKFDAIVVAYGRNYADALAGSYLAVVTNAPILLVNTDKNNKNDKASMDLVKEYIKNNLATDGTVYVLGGKAVISEEYFSSLSKLKDVNVKRLAGDNRYETDLKILDAAKAYDSNPSKVIISDAYGFADALSASALGCPILLIDKSSGKLSKDQKAYLLKTSPEEVIIIGGTAAVPESIKTEIKSLLSNIKIDRCSGSNRYETSCNLANKLFKDVKVAVIAYGHDFPDGLCGGPLANALDAPLILVHSDSANLQFPVNYFKASSINAVRILGGINSIPDAVVSSLRSGATTSSRSTTKASGTTTTTKKSDTTATSSTSGTTTTTKKTNTTTTTKRSGTTTTTKKSGTTTTTKKSSSTTKFKPLESVYVKQVFVDMNYTPSSKKDGSITFGTLTYINLDDSSQKERNIYYVIQSPSILYYGMVLPLYCTPENINNLTFVIKQDGKEVYRTTATPGSRKDYDVLNEYKKGNLSGEEIDLYADNENAQYRAPAILIEGLTVETYVGDDTTYTLKYGEFGFKCRLS